MRSWLWHCSQSRKIAGSIHDGIYGILIDLILPASVRPWGRHGCNRHPYQESFLCVGLTTLPPT